MISRLLLVFLVVSCAFSLGSAAYNEPVAKSLSFAAAAAYTNSPSTCLSAHVQVLDTFLANLRGAPIFGYTAYDSKLKAVILSFRGTENGGQLVDELLHASSMPFPGHAGMAVVKYFYEAYRAVFNDMYKAYARAIKLYPTAPVYIVGHSLGGAIASITSIELQRLNPNMGPTFLYTYGAPRAGNYTLSVTMNKRIPNAHRVVNAGDIVAHMPPCSSGPGKGSCDVKKGLIWFAFHHGSEVWYKDGMPHWNGTQAGAFKDCRATPLGEDSSCSNSLSPFFSIGAHLNYFNLKIGTHCLKMEMKETFLQQEAARSRMPAASLEASAQAFERRWEATEAAEEARQQAEIDAVVLRWREEMLAKHDRAVLHAEQPDLF